MYRALILFTNLAIIDCMLNNNQIDLNHPTRIPANEELLQLERVRYFIWPVTVC